MRKKILILGGSSDIGLSLLKSLDEKEYEIFIHYNKNKPNNNISKNVKLIKKNFYDMKFNNIDREIKEFKNFDIIINLIAFLDNKTYYNVKYKDLIKSFNANFLIPFFIIKKSIKFMKKKRYGRIINCSSIGTKFGGGKTTLTYSFSKHCSEFIPSELRDLAEKNILINNLKLGVVNTKLHKKIPSKIFSKRVKLIPAKRPAEKKEIIKLINFFINQNTYISSQSINISGGE